jgi:carbonic anhydrase
MGGVATAVGLNWGERGPHAATAATPSTPQEALQALLDGNDRYASSLGGVNNNMTSFAEDLSEIRLHTENNQFPFASLLSCADSRVPPEIIFDQSIGQLFVCRVAGNITTPEIIASLEYSVAVLNTVRVIMVLGHGGCGAVSAAGSLTRVADTQISALYAPLRPAVILGGANCPGPTCLDDRIRTNARIQAIILRESSPVLSDRTKSNQLLVVAAHYDLASGRVTLLP